MGSSILGALTGGVLGLDKDYEDKRSADRQEALAKEQAEALKRQQQDEEQARRKQQQNSPDASQLLQANTAAGLGSTSLTGASGVGVNPNRLGRGSTLLGA